MNSQHLSDEATAAYADGVLARHARERALRHTADCPECAYAVAVQREAVWALRAAPAPPLPTGLLDRLCAVPATTPINVVPAAIAADGSTMFATFGRSMTPVASAALVPNSTGGRHPGRSGRLRPIVSTAAAVAVAGVLVVGSAGHASGQQRPQQTGGPTVVVPAGFTDGSLVHLQQVTLHGDAGR